MANSIEITRDKKGKIFSPIRNQWLVETPEERVRQELVVRLVNEYGYPLENMIEEYKNEYEGRGVRRTRADIVIFKSEQDKINNYNAYIVIECKAETVKIHLKDFYQGTEYAAKLHATFLILHNEKETHYYDVKPYMIPNVEDAFEQINGIPKYEEIYDEKRVNEIKKETRKFTRDEFTTLLFKCHNIIRNNDKLSPEAAFDEISKLLFIKINYERNQQGKEIYTLAEFEKREKVHEQDIRPQLRGTNRDLPYMQFMFLQTKDEFINDHLFEENEIIKIRETSFKAILKELQKYNLSDTSDDVKGIAFEEFLGRTFRGELGQFFTPRTIVDFMTEILDPQEGELICDPCCGSGGFLIKAFEYIKEKIEKDIQIKKDEEKALIMAQYPEDLTEKQSIEMNEKIDKSFVSLNLELEHLYSEKNACMSRLDKLSYKSIYGTDANPRMARTSKMNMIMHGDGHGGVHHHDGLINVNGIFEGRFDVILTNPPFGSNVSREQKIEWDDIDNDEKRIKAYAKMYGDSYLNQLEDLKRRVQGKNKNGYAETKEKLLLNLYETGKMSTLTEILFIERCIRLLTPGGRMGIVLPEGVLNNSKLQKVRDYFESQAKIILICSIPQDVFIKAGATVKPSLVFFKKFTKEERKNYDDILAKATSDINYKYQDEICELELLKVKKMIDSKGFRKRMNTIEDQKAEEIKQLVKERFDYQIPIAKVEKAGITTTGAVCENELEIVAEEFRQYNATAKLWELQPCGGK